MENDDTTSQAAAAGQPTRAIEVAFQLQLPMPEKDIDIPKIRSSIRSMWPILASTAYDNLSGVSSRTRVF